MIVTVLAVFYLRLPGGATAPGLVVLHCYLGWVVALLSASCQSASGTLVPVGNMVDIKAHTPSIVLLVCLTEAPIVGLILDADGEIIEG